MSEVPFMPKATAVWLVENTTLTFKQIARFCDLHELEIKGIADGNADFSKSLGLTVDKSVNYMGIRSERYAMIVNNCEINQIYIEKPGKFEISSASHILSIL